MLKKMAPMILMLALAALLPLQHARAEEGEAEDELMRALDVNAVEQAAGLPAEISLRGGVDLDRALKLLYGTVRRDGPDILGGAVKGAAVTVIISFLCAAAQGLSDGAASAAKLAGTAAAAIIFVQAGGGLLSQAMNAVGKLQDFANVLLPTLAAAEAASGLFTSAAVKYTAAALFFNILTNIISGALAPLVYIYTAAAIGEAVTGSRALSGAVSLIKYAAVTLLTVLLLGFTLYISVSGFIASGTDAAKVKAAKTAISTLMPLAGSIASDAAGTIMSAGVIIKNSVGAFGLVAVIFICAGPFLNTGGRYLVYKCASALTCEAADGTVAKLTGRFAEACGIMTSAIGAAALIQFVSVFSFMGAMSP